MSWASSWGAAITCPYLPNKLKYFIPLLVNRAKLALSRRGRRILRNNLAEARVDHQLLRSAKKEFDGELVLFVTDTSVQRHGIGTTLLRQFYQFMEQNNSKNIYLFTDTTCNYGYYQKKGYRQIAEKRVHYQTQRGPATEDHFLYTTSLEQCSGDYPKKGRRKPPALFLLLIYFNPIHKLCKDLFRQLG